MNKVTYPHSARTFFSLFAIRLVVFIFGLVSTKYPDWRQAAGYPLLLAGSLPDAFLAKYLCSPQSRQWPWLMVGSLTVSSFIFVRAYANLRAHRLTGSE
jgi:hypothetical protein